jgi:hypothetical protein
MKITETTMYYSSNTLNSTSPNWAQYYAFHSNIVFPLHPSIEPMLSNAASPTK